MVLMRVNELMKGEEVTGRKKNDMKWIKSEKFENPTEMDKHEQRTSTELNSNS